MQKALEIGLERLHMHKCEQEQALQDFIRQQFECLDDLLHQEYHRLQEIAKSNACWTPCPDASSDDCELVPFASDRMETARAQPIVREELLLQVAAPDRHVGLEDNTRHSSQGSLVECRQRSLVEHALDDLRPEEEIVAFRRQATSLQTLVDNRKARQQKIREILSETNQSTAQEDWTRMFKPFALKDSAVGREVWELICGSEAAKGDWQEDAVTKAKKQWSFAHHTARRIGMSCFINRHKPSSLLVKIVDSSTFGFLVTSSVVANTVYLGVQAHWDMHEAIRGGGGVITIPTWMVALRRFFLVFFSLELLLRVIAFRMWFLVGSEWMWNLFDVLLVLISFLGEMTSGSQFGFLRVMRVVRVVRVARVIRVFKAFTELREMFLAIMACLASLGWVFVFFALLLYVFSVFFLQGASNYIAGLDPTSVEHDDVIEELRDMYGGIDSAMLTLLSAVTGGLDWMDARQPLSSLGSFYSGAFVVYVLFVTLGVMNVLTGVFVGNAASVSDPDISVHKANDKLDAFVKQMIALFQEFDRDSSSEINWKSFKACIQQKRVQAYLASHELDATHALLLFHLLDTNGSGTIDLHEFVVGMERLKGAAKTLDARVVQRDVHNMSDALIEVVKVLHDHIEESTIDRIEGMLTRFDKENVSQFGSQASCGNAPDLAELEDYSARSSGPITASPYPDTVVGCASSQDLSPATFDRMQSAGLTHAASRPSTSVTCASNEDLPPAPFTKNGWPRSI